MIQEEKEEEERRRRIQNNNLEHAMLIILHADGEPLVKRNSSYSVCNDSACCLVCQWRRYSVLTSKASSNLLNDDTYRWVCVGYCVIDLDK